MLKREVESFIFDIFIFNLKCGFLSWGHQFYVKSPHFFVLPIYTAAQGLTLATLN